MTARFGTTPNLRSPMPAWTKWAAPLRHAPWVVAWSDPAENPILNPRSLVEPTLEQHLPYAPVTSSLYSTGIGREERHDGAIRDDAEFEVTHAGMDEMRGALAPLVEPTLEQHLPYAPVTSSLYSTVSSLLQLNELHPLGRVGPGWIGIGREERHDGAIRDDAEFEVTHAGGRSFRTRARRMVGAARCGRRRRRRRRREAELCLRDDEVGPGWIGIGREERHDGAIRDDAEFEVTHAGMDEMRGARS
jgi:hypothetical protein